MTIANTVSGSPDASRSADYQHRVYEWAVQCFGQEVASDPGIRVFRFVEEAIELAQAANCSLLDLMQLVHYVYSRPVGDPAQEVGGVMVTLASLCSAHGIDLREAAEVELCRVWQKIDTIRSKSANKPKNGPLPTAMPAASKGQRGEGYRHATDWDHRIIDGTSVAMGGSVSCGDDVERLIAKVVATEPTVREKTLAEIAVAFARWSQDLKEDRDASDRKLAGMRQTLERTKVGEVLSRIASLTAEVTHLRQVAEQVREIAREREAGYAARKHGGVVNQAAADAVVRLAALAASTGEARP